uniref:Uncharacterized protein n=1 Tax=Cucumis sativus TaxID=3659 RepID=A0A0A0LBP7_CUCSA
MGICGTKIPLIYFTSFDMNLKKQVPGRPLFSPSPAFGAEHHLSPPFSPTAAAQAPCVFVFSPASTTLFGETPHEQLLGNTWTRAQTKRKRTAEASQSSAIPSTRVWDDGLSPQRKRVLTTIATFYAVASGVQQ